jgi:hypothetical protein
VVGASEVQPQRPVGAENASDPIEDRRKVIDEEVRVRFEAQLTEPTTTPRTRPGRGEFDVGPGAAGLDRLGVLDVERWASPPRRAGFPLVGAGGAPSPERGWDSIVPQSPVGRRRDDTVNRLVGQSTENIPYVAIEGGRLQTRRDHGSLPAFSVRGELPVDSLGGARPLRQAGGGRRPGL